MSNKKFKNQFPLFAHDGKVPSVKAVNFHIDMSSRGEWMASLSRRSRDFSLKIEQKNGKMGGREKMSDEKWKMYVWHCPESGHTEYIFHSLQCQFFMFLHQQKAERVVEEEILTSQLLVLRSVMYEIHTKCFVYAKWTCQQNEMRIANFDLHVLSQAI